MNEEFLQYIWKFQLLKGKLCSSVGEEIVVIKPGEQNTDAGPDFSNARIRIGNTLWAGNVEVHVRASDWSRHCHSADKRYDNIILHVVAEDDMPVKRSNDEMIPTLCVKGNLDLSMIASYQELKQARRWIPCENLLTNASTLKVNGMLDRMMVERLQRKSAHILSMLESCHFSWEEVAYVLIARNFGARINGQVFEWLARSLPYSLIQRNRDQKFRLEALLFGQAGMLHDHFVDTYPKQLRTEYQFQQKKYGLVPLQEHLWNYLRLRPPGFPTIRLALFADLLYRRTNLFSQIVEAHRADELIMLFESECSSYWESHYIFDRLSRHRPKRLGDESIMVLIINAAVPLIFTYGLYINRQDVKEQAIHILRQLKGEVNAIARRWGCLGMPVDTAWNTQALLELKEKYCDRKKCLQCHIGNAILCAS